MTDGVIKGTGNSRYLKSVSNFKTLYPTYDDLVAALVAGTLPIDLKGINSSGWSTQGTPLTKANLLTDATAALYGYGSTATVNNILNNIASYKQYWINHLATISYKGTGTYGTANPTTLTFPFSPEIVLIYQNRVKNQIYCYGVNPNFNPNKSSVGAYWDSSALLVKNQNALRIMFTSPTGTIYNSDFTSVEFSGNTVKLASTDNAGLQLNDSTYTYYAIGIR